MKKLVIVIAIITLINNCFADEFIYPIAYINDENILVVRQKTLEDIELFIWNPLTKTALKQLSSMFLPSQVQLLPGKDGFSFIDRGRIRIKRFCKRTPRSINIFEPIDSVISMTWINDTQFYFTGRYYQNFKLFLCDISESYAEVFSLSNDNIDYLYSSKAEKTIFSIIKDQGQIYHLVKEDWLPTPLKEEAQRDQEIIYSSIEPICFLHMKNDREGYFLKCNILESYDILNFTCYRCLLDGQNWTLTPLFTFEIPFDYVSGDSEKRVYESIHPFLPLYDNNDYIFYINYEKEIKQCVAYSFKKDTKKIEPFCVKNSSKSNGLLNLLKIQNRLYFGLIIPQNFTKNIIFSNEKTGEIEIMLPSMDFGDSYFKS